MDISLKVKNSRWVSKLDVGVRKTLTIPDYLVLLEENADREAEARVVTYGDESTISVMAVTPVVVPWTQEKMVTHARHVSRFVASWDVLPLRVVCDC